MFLIVSHCMFLIKPTYVIVCTVFRMYALVWAVCTVFRMYALVWAVCTVFRMYSLVCTVFRMYTVGDHICIDQLCAFYCRNKTRGQSNLTKSTSQGAHSPVRGHPRRSKVVPLNSWGRVSHYCSIVTIGLGCTVHVTTNDQPTNPRRHDTAYLNERLFY